MGTYLLPQQGEKMESLRLCPKDKKNCVCSLEPDSSVFFISPLKYFPKDNTNAVKNRIKKIVQQIPRTTIVVENENHIHIEVQSAIFKFIDDVEFLIDSKHRLIHVRSASRQGYWDMNINRKRIISFKQLWQKFK